MDVLRKELNAFYDSQHLDKETLDSSVFEECKQKIDIAVEIENDCRVITDASADFCYISGGYFASLIGLSDTHPYKKEMNSSDEDEIYNRIHPEDLVDKRMLEYVFFKYVGSLPASQKLDYKATCHLRIKNRNEEFIYIHNTTRVMRLSPNGKVWLILCGYEISPIQEPTDGIEARIINCCTGEVTQPHFSERRSQILTEREKEILNLIKDGKLSKEIADILKISIHTVNRHRQNILEKLSVGNSMEAIMAATAMRLL